MRVILYKYRFSIPIQFYSILVLTVISFNSIISQSVGINNDGSTPNSNAILDINSPNKGVLIPRTDTIGITIPVKGMMIYDTISNGFVFYNGEKWLSILDASTNNYYYGDKDGDGFGYQLNAIYAPTSPPFYVSNHDDCDDTNELINPTADEICDGLDNDCDGEFDELGTNNCIIAGICYNSGDVNSENGCESCNPAQSTSSWSSICMPGQDCCNQQCVDLSTDINNCGSCGQICSFPNASSICVDSLCQLGVCDSGWADCDSNPTNGCETNLTIDVNNCGSCGQTCDDAIDCTVDVCLGGLCDYSQIQSMTCFINGVCYGDQEVNSSNFCLYCDTNNSQTSWTLRPVGTACSTTGVCDAAGNCQE